MPAERFSFTAPSLDYIFMKTVEYGIRESVGPFAARRLQASYLPEHMMIELKTAILACQMGEERIVEERRAKHECLRFATWWDHFKATYRGRWWMRWRRWEIAYANEHHELVARVDVDMTKYWTFPKATIDFPDEFGDHYPVIVNRRNRESYWNQ